MNDKIPHIPKLASIIYWKDTAEKERVERWIKKLMEQGHIEAHTTREYNSYCGEPVWFIP